MSEFLNSLYLSCSCGLNYRQLKNISLLNETKLQTLCRFWKAFLFYNIMKILLTKFIVFAVIIICIFYGNLELFRSEMPYLSFITIILSILFFIYFPYNKFFNTKNKK